jgi:hypothetical protein
MIARRRLEEANGPTIEAMVRYGYRTASGVADGAQLAIRRTRDGG